MNKIKKLPSEFKALGYDLTLIERTGKIAWYEARYVNGTKIKGYFVLKIRVKRAQNAPSGKFVPAYEEGPVESEGGQRAHFYMANSRDLAKGHFEVLVAEEFSIKNQPAKA
ncbi:hypothetical protein OAK38_06055 [Verrucomicrobia bacterium]|nr:hypothetical protein [Verrucomicrobiota bacterium]